MKEKTEVVLYYIISLILFSYAVFAYKTANLTSWSEPFETDMQGYLSLSSIPAFVIGFMFLIVATMGFIVTSKIKENDVKVI